MRKKFNVAGTCIPVNHYRVDTSEKINEITKLIDNEEYFIINRPRQYGKTKTLFLLNNKLKQTQGYLPIKISFEGIEDLVYENESRFSKGFMRLLERTVEFEDIELANFISSNMKEKKP